MGRNLPVMSALKIMTECHLLFWGLAGRNLPAMLASPILKEALPLVRGQAVRNLLVIALLEVEGALLLHGPPVAQLLNLLPFRRSITAPPPVQELDFNLAVGYPFFRFAAALRPPMVPVGVR